MVRDLQTVKRKVKRFERHLREKVQLVGVLVPVIGKWLGFCVFHFDHWGLDQEGV